MSNTTIIVAGIVGASLIILLGCLIMIVMTRLRRAIEMQFKAIENALSAVRAEQSQDKPAQPS